MTYATWFRRRDAAEPSGTRTGEGMMKKLALNLETLAVETFEIAQAGEERGTVQAAMTSPDNCVSHTCGDSVIRACMD
jgi:hypothetical protein